MVSINGTEAKVLNYREYVNNKTFLRQNSSQTSDIFDWELAPELFGRNADDRFKTSDEISFLFNAFLNESDFRHKQTNYLGQFLLRKAYTAIGEARFNIKCNECKERVSMQMRTLIPVQYAVFGAVTLLLTVTFGTLLCVSIFTSYIVMNPWVNIIYFLGSLSLFATDIAAICERQKGDAN